MNAVVDGASVIVLKDGKPLLITGLVPAERTIINTVLCVVLNVTEFGMSVSEAVSTRGCTTSGSQTWLSSKA